MRCRQLAMEDAGERSRLDKAEELLAALEAAEEVEQRDSDQLGHTCDV